MSKLRLAPDLTLPIDAVTQAIGILAKRRVGKSYTARRFAEQLFHAGQQIVIVDPKGDWWGIRSSADGKGPGLGVVILGGERGDLPLYVENGEVVAKLVAEERVSVLLDLSLFRKREVARFMADFLETLYRLKAKESLRTPLMLIIDEADAIAPQKPQEGEERMLGAAEDIVRRGGQRGLGCTMISQRTAVLNKNVLTQCEMLVALRTIAPQDLKAMQAWIDVHGEPAQRDTLMTSLPALPQGDAWFWSPGWPTGDGIFKRVHVLPIETFDSGASPKAGEKRKEPKNLADVDLGALQKQMAATIEKAKAEDPRELRKRIAELEKAAKTAPARTVEKPVAEPRAIERAVATAERAHLQRAERVRRQIERALAGLRDVGRVLEPLAVELGQDAAAAVLTGTADIRDVLRTGAVSAPAVASRSISAPRPRASGSGESLPKGEQLILAAAAQYPDGAERDQLSILTGYKRSTRDAYVQRLGEKGYIEVRGQAVVATDAGIAALGDDYEPLPTGAALRDYWLARLPEGERKVLAVLIEAYPEAVSRDVISDQTGYKRSTRDAYIQRLGTRKLVDLGGMRGEVVAHPALFEGGR